ncbi:unnamed protein product [Adineta ricciae]|uniref:Uncharacterized protein n=1 Tax=Adineta ricciae TaxID=249248 RepID=A0A814VMF6_ADIRI|nr:unnamed protein product [Adineta ricciae]CAF1192646.1 unnamed protein product [Adineta ricciae]
MAESESSHNESSATYHLDYLDEFLRLRCAPDLISMGIFPNAKEVTESFAIWSAIRRHILPNLSSTSSTTGRRNAIIVVGDGMTPRTAGLCAYLTKGLWQCFSIDPILQYDSYTDMAFLNRRSLTTIDHCNEWKATEGLRMARAKIQSVSILCRQAIVVMMHAHVTLDDAIAAINASEGIVGIVTCPCCKWGPYQQEWLGKLPHQQYKDSNLLSTKNQMNVWYFPEGCHVNKPSTASNEIVLPEKNVWGLDLKQMESILSTRHGVKQRAIDMWPHIFHQGIKAFDMTDNQQLSIDLDSWPWATSVWSPKELSSFIKTCSPTSTTWFQKPILVVGTIGAVRRCKHTIFYELNTCAVPSDQLEAILRSSDRISSKSDISEERMNASSGKLKSADHMWTYVEYQQHLQAIASFDSTVERKTKKQNPSTTAESLDSDRLNVVLSLVSYQHKIQSENEDEQVKVFRQNPQPRQTLFPWAIYLRPGDILVAYCQLGRNSSQGPQICLVDGILLYDSILYMTGIDRRILR